MGNKPAKYESIPINEPMEDSFQLSQELSSWPHFRCSDTEQHRVGMITDVTIDNDYVKFTVSYREFTIRRKLYIGVQNITFTNYLNQFDGQYVDVTYRIEYLTLADKLLRPFNIKVIKPYINTYEITDINNDSQNKTKLTVANGGSYNCVLLRAQLNYGDMYKHVAIGAYIKITSVNIHLDNSDALSSLIINIEPADVKDVMSYATVRITALIHNSDNTKYEIVGTHKGDPLKKRYLIDKGLTTDVVLLGYYSIGYKTIDGTWRLILSIKRKKST